MNPSVKPQPRALVGNSSLERHERVDFRGRCERTAPVLFGFGLKVSRSRGPSGVCDRRQGRDRRSRGPSSPTSPLRGGAGQAGQRDAVEERNRRLTGRGAKRDELQQFRGGRGREGHGSRHPAGEAPRRDIHRRGVVDLAATASSRGHAPCASTVQCGEPPLVPPSTLMTSNPLLDNGRHRLRGGTHWRQSRLG